MKNGGSHARVALVVVVAMAAGLPMACGERKAKEACEDFMEQLSHCPAFGMSEPDCSDVTASERERYECLAALEDVCDIEAQKGC